MKKREATIKRETKETSINIAINLDRAGNYSIKTPIGFFNHMLELFSKHGNFDLSIEATGDIDVDYHHLVEDTGIVLGDAIKKALGSFSGIKRYGNKVIPMDDSLSMVTIDLSNRAYLMYNVNFEKHKIGNFDVELFEEFFQAIAYNLKCNLHVNNFYGKNSHHIIESIFKAFAYALKEAIIIKGDAPLSTKGIL
jgi:imidazoleglycerol-phosphate dehydratase